VQAIGLIDLIHLLKERHKDFLKNLARLILIESGAPWNRINQTLVTINERLP